MADDLTTTSTNPSGLPDGTKLVSDEHATRGHMFLSKLAMSADGSATPIPADANGMLVNINNAELAAIAADMVTVAATVAGNEQQVDIVGALPAGTNNIGDVDVLSLPAIPAGTNNIGDVDVLTIAAGTNAIGNIGVIPRTTGGLTIFRSLDLDETEEDVKTSAGQVFGWYFFNAAASTRYVKFYNTTAASVTVGSTTPVMTIPVPAGGAANAFSEIGIAFSSAICVAATTGVADADAGAPAANDVIVQVFYA